MYCPRCKDEFRTGFTRCANCGVDLVDSPPESARNRDRAEKAVAWSSVVPMADYCGFFSMDDARRARDALKAAEIRSEIVIRESVGNEPGLDDNEEYWLRVESSKHAKAAQLLERALPETDPRDSGEFACGDCGSMVAAEETFCPGCGARFEDD